MNAIFKTTTSKTSFGFDTAQSEKSGLSDYLRKERKLIIEHLTNGTGGLVMGGFAGIGKTTLSDTIAKQTDSNQIDRLCELDNSRSQHYFTQDHTKPTIIIDEGMGFLRLSTTTTQYLKGFLDTKKARVVLGGAFDFTSKEQTTAIAAALKNMGVPNFKTYSLPVSRLSDLQIAELLILKGKKKNKHISDITQNIIDACANIVEPLRIPRHICNCFSIEDGRIQYDPDNYIIGRYNFGIIPQDQKHHAHMIKLFGQK